jgi:hypothetical protein
MSDNSRVLYYTFDKPVPYKKLLLHPIRMRDYFEFNYLASCLSLEKDLSIEAITMTYLEYLFHLASEENNLLALLDGLLRFVLNKKDEKDFEITYGKGGDGRPLIGIEGELYNSDDFDKIRDVIVDQNYVTVPDPMIQKNVRDAMAEARAWKARLNKTTVASLEDQLLALSLFSGLSLDEISNFTIRKFVKAIRRANHMIHQNIYLQASVSGMVTFKDKTVLTGWLAEIEDDEKNSDVTMDLDSLKGKADFSSAKV